jgi:hypothetical protein
VEFGLKKRKLTLKPIINKEKLLKTGNNASHFGTEDFQHRNCGKTIGVPLSGEKYNKRTKDAKFWEWKTHWFAKNQRFFVTEMQ